MVLNKFDKKSDAVADLYRSALYLARGSKEMGLQFFGKAKKKLSPLFEIPVNKLKTRQQQLFWAEKILDQYKKLRPSLG